MSTKEKKDRATQRHTGKLAKKRIIFLLGTVLLITLGSIIFGSSFSAAQDQSAEQEVEYKYYKSIEIKKGDSLWSIAQEYKADDYESTREYIEELKELNNLTSDTIHQGQYLMVVYYDKEYK